MKIDEFYVGYLPEAPSRTASVIRRTVFVLGLLVLSISLVLVWYQKRFSTGTFEYGILTSVNGYVFTTPAPHLSVPLGVNANGDSLYQNILLVDFGKAGANKVIINLQQKIPGFIDGSRVTLKGYLIYGDGQALMQITKEDNSDVLPADGSKKSQASWTSLGPLTVSGEVVDPKCYFGVMKPGEGKSHRSCAIRCIAGGIPPIFHASGTSGYFVLVNEKNETVNEEILPLVGDLITLSGEGFMLEDWKILRLKATEIQKLSDAKKWKEELKTFENGISLCTKE